MASAKDRKKREARKFKPATTVERAPLPAPANAPYRKPVEDPANWGPARDETVAASTKVMPPPIENMRARGTLSSEQCQAADEIRLVFHWLTSGLCAKIMDPTKSGGKALPSSGADRLQAAYTERYLPWSQALSGARNRPESREEVARVLRSADENTLKCAAKALNRPDPRRYSGHPKTMAIVIAVVVDGRSVVDAAKDETVRERSARQALHDGLELYAEMSGWLRRAA